MTIQFDLWFRDAWIGMSEGETVQDARKLVKDSYPDVPDDQIIMTPFYGCGTSYATFKALLGRDPA